MNLYMVSVIGFEGAVILGIIAAVSLALAGVRFSRSAAKSHPKKGRLAVSSSVPKRTVEKVETVTAPSGRVQQPATPNLQVAEPTAAEASANVEDPEGRIDSQTQWERVSGIVADGIEKASDIEALHDAAGRQLDAVDYAYERMLLELSEVLPDVTENRSVCRANRDEAYAEADVAIAAALAREAAEQLSEELADSDELAGAEPGEKSKTEPNTVAA